MSQQENNRYHSRISKNLTSQLLTWGVNLVWRWKDDKVRCIFANGGSRHLLNTVANANTLHSTLIFNTTISKFSAAFWITVGMIHEQHGSLTSTLHGFCTLGHFYKALTSSNPSIPPNPRLLEFPVMALLALFKICVDQVHDHFQTICLVVLHKQRYVPISSVPLCAVENEEILVI